MTLEIAALLTRMSMSRKRSFSPPLEGRRAGKVQKAWRRGPALRNPVTSEASGKKGGIYDGRTVLATRKRKRRAKKEVPVTSLLDVASLLGPGHSQLFVASLLMPTRISLLGAPHLVWPVLRGPFAASASTLKDTLKPHVSTTGSQATRLLFMPSMPTS